MFVVNKECLFLILVLIFENFSDFVLFYQSIFKFNWELGVCYKGFKFFNK